MSDMCDAIGEMCNQLDDLCDQLRAVKWNCVELRDGSEPNSEEKRHYRLVSNFLEKAETSLVAAQGVLLLAEQESAKDV